MTLPTVNTAGKTFRRVLLLLGVFAVALAVVGGAIGFAIAGSAGLSSAVIAAILAIVFSGITALSMLIAIRYDTVVFFAIVMGSWILKLVVFMIVLAVLRDQQFIHTGVFFVTLMIAVVGTLAIDAVVVLRSRVGYVSDATLPTYTDSDAVSDSGTDSGTDATR